MSVLYDLSKDLNDPDIDELLLYFDRTYVNGTYKRTATQSNGLSLWRSSPIFPPYLWNVHNATKKNAGRTNNISEGFNNKFKTLVRTQHPNIWMFIEALQKSNSMAINKLLKIKTGTFFLTKKNKYERRLQNMCLDIKKESEIKCFLQNISFLCRNYT